MKPASERRRSSSRSSARRAHVRKWAKFSLIALVLLVSVLGLVAGFVFYPRYIWAQSEVQKLDSLAAADVVNPTVIISADGKTLYQSITRFQDPIKYPDIPQVVIDATLAAEDERFFSHAGVDWKSAVRAVFSNVKEGRTVQGASTITMQLAKRLFTSDKKNFDRKLRDIALAYAIENTKTKEEILKLYLNNVFYGAGAYGISAAADVYFGKELSELTIAEAALLARLVQRPSVDNPYRNRDGAVAKRNIVLAKMRELGKISEAEYQEALDEPVKLRKDFVRAGERILAAPYFVNYVLDTVKRTHPELDLSKGGFRIETTLDLGFQKIAESAVGNIVRANRRSGVTTGAFLCMDYEGKILAMVGGADYKRSQYNVIAQGSRQPGSAMKPFVYAAALSSGALGFHESVSNAPHYLELPNGERKLWPKGGGNGGSVSIRTALAKSINVPAAWVMDKVGPGTAVSYAKQSFGFTSELAAVPSLVLGASAVSPLELAEAYSVFMLYGDRAKPFGIVRIVTPDGTILDDFGPKVVEDALDPSVADFIDKCLRAVVTSGTGGRASSIPNARGKTGTTQDNRDAWFCGYTNNLLGIGWVANEQFVNGRSEYKVMPGVMGGKVTVNIWVEFMKGALKRYDDSPTHDKGARNSEPTIEAESERVEPPAEIPEDKPIVVSPPIDPNENPSSGNPDRTGGGTTEPPTSHEPPVNRIPDPPETVDERDLIAVELCVESAARANPYCPETVTRRLVRKDIPRRCRAHGPALLRPR